MIRKIASALALALCATSCITFVPTKPNGEGVGKGDVVINEVNTDAKYIELYNAADEEAYVGGWTIVKNNESPLDNAEGTAPYYIPDGTIIPPHGFAVLNCKGRTDVYSGVALGVSESGISGKKSLLLELVDAEGAYVDHFVNSAVAQPASSDEWDGDVEYTFDVAARMPDGVGEWWVVDGATPGEGNSAKLVSKFTHTDVVFVEPDNGGGNGGDNGGSTGGDNGGSTGGDNGGSTNPDIGTSSLLESVNYVWNEGSMPKITLSVSESEWNRMLETYDRNSATKQYFKGDVIFDNGVDVFNFKEAGWRLRGNTSRRRPEGNGGEMHNRENPDWHHFHTQLNFRKFHKDSDHTIGGVRKVHLKWFKDDPMYVREVFSYDLFRRYGVWTAIRDIYCRFWIHVEGDAAPVYYGVYGMLETIDDEYLEIRSDLFGGHKGNLWKCGWGADLKNYNDDWKFGLDQDTDEEWVYELKTEHNSFSSAKSQLKDFMRKLNSKSGQDLHDWLGEVIDIPLFLKTYAVNVAVGMWDDYWNNSNNYYIYFNNSGTEGYKFYFIPYDYDNSLGTTNNCGVQNDAVRHNPLQWGNGNDNPLVAKVLQFDDYKALYIEYLNEIVHPAGGYMDYESSRQRIIQWHSKIRDYISNDTGEDMEIKDRPAGWSSHGEYRLLDEENNYFKIKAASIPTK
ncbi:MAG: CotH kinase family protein [Tidjanibacter sp.]|nr:CotH kinase family protein [Tidjanibacter sp.]